MYKFLAAVVVVGALVGCSNTSSEPDPIPSASTEYQAAVNSFCQDVDDALHNDGTGDPEDNSEQLAEMLELAQQLGYGSRDNVTAANQLTQCEQKLQDAIENETASPSPSAS